MWIRVANHYHRFVRCSGSLRTKLARYSLLEQYQYRIWNRGFGNTEDKNFFPEETLVIGFSYQATQTVHPLLSTWLYTYDIHVDCLINSSINCCFLVLVNWKKKNWIHFYLAVFFFFLQNTHTQIRNIENTVKNKPEYVIYSLIFTAFLASVTMTLIVAMWTFELQQL